MSEGLTLSLDTYEIEFESVSKRVVHHPGCGKKPVPYTSEQAEEHSLRVGGRSIESAIRLAKLHFKTIETELPKAEFRVVGVRRRDPVVI